MRLTTKIFFHLNQQLTLLSQPFRCIVKERFVYADFHYSVALLRGKTSLVFITDEKTKICNR